MSSFVAAGLLGAVILFWAVGAYNRLVRLRASAIAAFAAMDAQFQHYVALVQSEFPAPGDGATPAMAGLGAAGRQFDASLRAARLHPLDALTLRTLAAAMDTLSEAWSRLCSEPPDLAGARVPQALQQQWQRIAQQAEVARAEFNRQVQTYNQALELFPANVLASLFRLKPAHVI